MPVWPPGHGDDLEADRHWVPGAGETLRAAARLHAEEETGGGRDGETETHRGGDAEGEEEEGGGRAAT